MKRCIPLLLISCLLLCGCADRQVEEELLVIVLAIDQADSGKVSVAVKVPANSSAAGGGSGGQEQDQAGYMQLEATGQSFSDAVSMLNATTPRQLNFSQVREIVIGEAAAKQPDFGPLLQQIDALPRFRCSAAVIICRGSALSFSEKQKPYVGMRLSRYAENTLANYAGKGFTPSTDLCSGVRDLGCGFRDPLFILGAVNDFSASQAPGENNSLSAQAGFLPRKSAEPVETFGAAATDGVCVSGCLTGYEMALIHLLQGHVEALSIQQNGTALHITSSFPAALRVDLSARPAVLGLSLQCSAQYPPGYAPDEEALQNRLREDLTGLLRHLQALRCDGIGFGDAAVRQFLTVQDWERLQWRRVYSEALVQVEVDVRCREM